METNPTPLKTRCCIAGGGPAGMMLGLLLARAGVDVGVLEKHGDFLRDFRGDTLHPSTLEVIHELGVLDALLKIPHQKVAQLTGQFGEFESVLADFSHLPVRCPYIVLMPQWDFLDFLAGEAEKHRGFTRFMKATATGLIERDGRIVGVRASTPEGEREILADLVVGADGRDSATRQAAGLTVEDFGSPIDVFWFRLSRKPDDTDATGGRFDVGRLFVRIYRGDYWQCAYVIPKGQAERIRAKGLDAFRVGLVPLLPFSGDRVDELKSWDDVKLLTVKVDRLTTWFRPGFLCIGDAAHAMSPVGGVGINLAIQDAVAAANILAEPLRNVTIDDTHLRAVQNRREFPTRMTQSVQIAVQNRLLSRVFDATASLDPPFAIRLLARFPVLRRLPARMVGMGVRPEHVRTAAVKSGVPSKTRGRVS